jgi:hypothetical protein
MMALVYHHKPVAVENLGDVLAPCRGLERDQVDDPVTPGSPSLELTDLSPRKPEQVAEPLSPLLCQRFGFRMAARKAHWAGSR